MPAGRPTQYSPEILDKAREYIASCEDTEREVKSFGDKVEYKLKVKLPNKGGLALYLDVSRDTLYEWAKVYPEFSDIMERLGAKQEDALINNGISGDYNPTISKVLLTKHGYTDKTETDITSKGESINIPNSEAVKLAKEYEEKLKSNQ